MPPGVQTPEPWRCTVPGGQVHGGTWPAHTAGAPVVLALHDLGANHRWWVLVAQELAGQATLVAPDLPGHGRSSALASGSFDDLVGRVETLLSAQLPPGSPLLLAGAGTGALLADRLASRLTIAHPHRHLCGVIRIAAPTRPADVRAAGATALARIGRTYAHRQEDLAWWRTRPGLGHGLSRAVRWVAEADLAGHGFAWTVVGNASALERDAAAWADELDAGTSPAVSWPVGDVRADDTPAAAHTEHRAFPDQGTLHGSTLLLHERGAAATVAAIRSLLPH